MNPPSSMERVRTVRITGQDIYSLYAPSPCELRVHLRGKNEPKEESDPYAEVLRKLGERHEKAHLSTFSRFADLSRWNLEDRAQKTFELVTNREPVLYQPVLRASVIILGTLCEVVGVPDFLVREADGYVIRDAKLVQHPDKHVEVIRQVQLYAWLYERVFEERPLRLEVLNGQGELVPVPNESEGMLRDLNRIIELKTASEQPYSPVGRSKCLSCCFRDRCWKQAKATNDLALVVGVDSGLAIELHCRGVQTIQQLIDGFDETTLARVERPWGNGVNKVGKAARAILRSAQALLSNRELLLSYENFPKFDRYIAFDLEGLPPHLDQPVKVYLWGAKLSGQTPGEYQAAIAGFDQNGDRQGWYDFLRMAEVIFREHGSLAWVHWAAYEPTLIKEYIRRFGDPQGVAARVLDNLVDLLPITRRSIVLPIYSYSLKEVERYIGFVRTQRDFGGSWSMARYVEATESEDRAFRDQVMSEIIRYNAEDLLATAAVYQWLRNECDHACSAELAAQYNPSTD